MKKHLYFVIALFFLSLNLFAQIEIVKIIDEGGSGDFKALAKSEESLPNFVIYRPADIKSVVKKVGKLPVIVWANGGCMNSSIHHERLLTEVASHGYVIIAIGKLQISVEERVHQQTPEDEMLKALEWISNQAILPNSEYFKSVDLKKIAAAGQSCGGAQTFRIASDQRIKTYLIFNAGMGNMTMAGASAASLKNLHGPILYLIGGESDVAYNNAILDYEKISHVPVAFANHLTAGHGGTFSEKFGGSFAAMAIDWLDWQLKAKKTSNVFLKSNLSQYPDWTMMIKNF